MVAGYLFDVVVPARQHKTSVCPGYPFLSIFLKQKQVAAFLHCAENGYGVVFAWECFPAVSVQKPIVPVLVLRYEVTVAGSNGIERFFCRIFVSVHECHVAFVPFYLQFRESRVVVIGRMAGRELCGFSDELVGHRL